MLFSLGLRRYPPIDILLGIAAGRSPTNEKALLYLLANISTHYITFDPTTFGAVSFIPATTSSGEQVLAKPGEVGFTRISSFKDLNANFRSSPMTLARY